LEIYLPFHISLYHGHKNFSISVNASSVETGFSVDSHFPFLSGFLLLFPPHQIHQELLEYIKSQPEPFFSTTLFA
jgi:hypothetical protein